MPISHNIKSRRPIVLIGWLFIALVLAASAEIAGLSFLLAQRSVHARVFRFDIDQYADSLSDETISTRARARELGHLYSVDANLGWTRTPSTEHTHQHGTTISTDAAGARRDPSASGPVAITTYGDSFTEGLECNDDETWQAFMANAIGAQVLNFGVSGYGPDQALLAMERDLHRGIAGPIVILAMINENGNRIVNTFRPFYTYPAEEDFGFKPVFQETADGFEIYNPVPRADAGREEIRSKMWEASKRDLFYSARIEAVEFPYSLSAARFLTHWGLKPPWPGLSATAQARLAYILRRFHQNSLDYGFIPVFALLPQGAKELQTRDGKDHSVWAKVVASTGLDRLIYIDVAKELSGDKVSVYVEEFDPEKYVIETHPGAYGNRAIAAVLLAALEAPLRRSGFPPGTAIAGLPFGQPPTPLQPIP